MTETISLAILAAAIVLLLLWMLRGAASLPICLSRGQRLTLVLCASGDGTQLEAAVRGLVWMIENGTLPASILIVDTGMDTEAKRTALLLQSRYRCVRILTSVEEHP